MSAPLSPRRRIAQRVTRFALYGACLLAGFGASFGLKSILARPLPVVEVDPDEHADLDTHPQVPPHRVRIAVAVKSENYDQALRLLDEFRDETGSDDRELIYCEALGLEVSVAGPPLSTCSASWERRQHRTASASSPGSESFGVSWRKGTKPTRFGRSIRASGSVAAGTTGMLRSRSFGR